MARHLKSIIKNRLEAIVSYYAPPSEISASHTRGVRYFVPITAINMLWGAMNTFKEGRHYNKHIIVRRVPRNGGQLLQLYTYHFPKTWSAACVANRELIKEAQRRAHALEHVGSYEALEWHIRFLKHYFRVFRCGEQPEPGMKRYSRFYQYTYVAIYRELQKAVAKAKEESERALEEISFEPVIDRFPLRRTRSINPLHNNLNILHTYDRDFLPPGARVLFCSRPRDCSQEFQTVHADLPQAPY